ncbi:copper resistance protein NlpE [Castellaniella sp.]|uniref:copper resistance protein NlpE n=1 Tax=Castellaniella sp. TaxID=1955812 RepID=UPI002AFE604E|nr:copper resistance protein NlpE [Castellaniella sp.]
MKKKLILALATAVLAGCTSLPTSTSAINSDHSARQALDWAGTYRGLLPCADCEGIETTVVLRQDRSYHQQTRYVGKGGQVFNQAGTFTWNPAGDTITLPDPEPAQYFVGEGWILRLATDGSRITGPLADHYQLTKLD